MVLRRIELFGVADMLNRGHMTDAEKQADYAQKREEWRQINNIPKAGVRGGNLGRMKWTII
jgi:hypothetical protein